MERGTDFNTRMLSDLRHTSDWSAFWWGVCVFSVKKTRVDTHLPQQPFFIFENGLRILKSLDQGERSFVLRLRSKGARVSKLSWTLTFWFCKSISGLESSRWCKVKIGGGGGGFGWEPQERLPNVTKPSSDPSHSSVAGSWALLQTSTCSICSEFWHRKDRTAVKEESPVGPLGFAGKPSNSVSAEQLVSFKWRTVEVNDHFVSWSPSFLMMFTCLSLD